MRWCGILFLVGATAGIAAPQDLATLKQVGDALQRLTNAYQKKDVEAIKALTGEDLVVVSGSGERQTRDEQLQSLPDLKITEFRVESVRLTMPSKDVAILTFQSTMAGSFKGKPLPAKSAVVTVWANRGGTWLEVFYQATPLEAK